VVEGDGRWTYRDRSSSGQPKSGTLPAAQRQQLQALLADPALPSEGRPWPGAQCQNGSYALSTGSILVWWQACGGGPRIAGAVVRLLAGATPL
jgi:hypothetical protein